ncbi:uncharacterized protein SEPMUDRAFT_148119 [Sphaerulina musiva SO2202]|uniref:Uncharacterized protein n=1 Tax=Sphaerulina musiva (strain SO2202) TaxID=692275 RepID=M3CKW7_SPHMS|nr:uncharacterized protein SEPMUDRAFT_148119 [Sphaerulina musiva SO2202]EMF14403.1 hypothetical protein SEPMUDRAFT_148119 [Sphaerulina musiva SO2202]
MPPPPPLNLRPAMYSTLYFSLANTTTVSFTDHANVALFSLGTGLGQVLVLFFATFRMSKSTRMSVEARSTMIGGWRGRRKRRPVVTSGGLYLQASFLRIGGYIYTHSESGNQQMVGLRPTARCDMFGIPFVL